MKHLIWLINNEEPICFVLDLLLFCPMFIILNGIMLFRIIQQGCSREDFLQLVDVGFSKHASNEMEREKLEHTCKFWMVLP